MPTVTRGRRCQNCTSFDNGGMALKFYKDRRAADIRRRATEILEKKGSLMAADQRRRINTEFSPETMKALGLNYDFGDRRIRAGVMGICLKGPCEEVPGTFVHAHVVCSRWTQRVKPDGSDKPDELMAEARANRGLDD